MGDFLSFRRMITPVLIQILFCVGVVASVAGGIGMVAVGSGADEVIGGILVIVLVPLLLRIWTEFVVVAFRINETLTDIRQNTAKP